MTIYQVRAFMVRGERPTVLGHFSRRDTADTCARVKRTTLPAGTEVEVAEFEVSEEAPVEVAREDHYRALQRAADQAAADAAGLRSALAGLVSEDNPEFVDTAEGIQAMRLGVKVLPCGESLRKAALRALDALEATLPPPAAQAPTPEEARP